MELHDSADQVKIFAASVSLGNLQTEINTWLEEYDIESDFPIILKDIKLSSTNYGNDREDFHTAMIIYRFADEKEIEDYNKKKEIQSKPEPSQSSQDTDSLVNEASIQSTGSDNIEKPKLEEGDNE